jgi:hypothetical protein
MTYAFDKSTGVMIKGEKVLENEKAVVLKTETGHKIITKCEKMKIVSRIA